MKTKYYIIIAILCCYYTQSHSQSVNINTRNSAPNLVWIIDGAGDNSATPSAGEMSNDVIINNKGNVGIGTHTPLAKLSIDAGSNIPLQIIDGFQAQDKMLTSDNFGNAAWGTTLPSTGSIEAILLLDAQTIPMANYTIPLAGSKFVVPIDGYYIYEIRWYGKYTAAATMQTMTTSHLRLDLDGVIVDEYEAYQDIGTNINDAVTFFTSLATQAKKGQTLSLINRLGFAPANSPMQLTNNGIDNDPTNTKIVVKRLEMN